MENNNHILSLYQFGGHSVLPVHEIYPHENQSTGPKFLGGGGYGWSNTSLQSRESWSRQVNYSNLDR